MALVVDPELKALIPPLTADERALLEESIVREGCRDPLVVWGDVLVDGHNRLDICERNGIAYQTVGIEFPDREAAKDWMDQNQLGRRNLTPDQFRLLLGRRYNRTKKSLGGQMPGSRVDQIDPPLSTAARLADQHAVSEATVKRAGKFAEKVEKTPELKEAVAQGKPAQQVERQLKEAAREKRREENRQKVASVPTPVAVVEHVKFATIVIDPPWDWGDEGDVNQMGRAKPDYSTMSLEQLRGLPMQSMADDDCHLYLWITNRSLPKGFGLIESWGFRYITAITWVKPSFGMGNYFRGQTEHILFAVKGSQPLKRKDIGTVFNAPRGSRHSEKPSEFFDLVESASPGPYLELFSRSRREGWVAWGESSGN